LLLYRLHAKLGSSAAPVDFCVALCGKNHNVGLAKRLKPLGSPVNGEAFPKLQLLGECPVSACSANPAAFGTGSNSKVQKRFRIKINFYFLTF
jgi:hypothetical protein